MERVCLISSNFLIQFLYSTHSHFSFNNNKIYFIKLIKNSFLRLSFFGVCLHKFDLFGGNYRYGRLFIFTVVDIQNCHQWTWRCVNAMQMMIWAPLILKPQHFPFYQSWNCSTASKSLPAWGWALEVYLQK